MRLGLWIIMVVMLSSLVLALDKPSLEAQSNVDVSVEDFEVVIHFVNNSLNITASHILFVDGDSFDSVVSSPYILNEISEGTHSLKVCAYDGNLTSCSDSISVKIVNGTAPVVKSVSYVYGAPIYKDVKMSQKTSTVVIESDHPVSIEFTYWANDDDFYGDDFDDVIEGDCEQISHTDKLYSFGCDVNLSYLYQAGFYDVKISADNGYKKSYKTFEDKINIFNLLSVEIVKPTIDYADVYNDWVDLDDPIIVKNTGNVMFDEVGLGVDKIECAKSFVFDIEDILVSSRDNRGAAEEVKEFNWFDLRVKRGEWEELYFFIYNPDEKDPADCELDWDLKARFNSGEV